MALDTRADADAAGEPGAGEGAADLTHGPVAIEVRDVEKSFRIPTQRITRLKERLVNPFARQEYRRLEALRDVSFDVHQGEFFGIVGRNGSGKSTLLKVMASIYGADRGRVRIAGRVAPFIELGVGFDMELTARENVVLNGVMMGLTPIEARERIDAVLEFAELGPFAELKLKNYSSGMLVRLAFSVMVQADTDVLLIDEVLAVGDAAFQQKCADQFREMRSRGKTIVLVTHDMSAVEQFCHRALLLRDGEIAEIGDPGEVARRYLQVNFERQLGEAESAAGPEAADVRLHGAWLEDEQGSRVVNAEQGRMTRITVEFEARHAIPGAQFGFLITNANEVNVHEFVTTLSQAGGGEDLAAGQRATVSASFLNRLAPGRYHLHVGVTRNRNRFDSAFHAPHLLGFVVYGDKGATGVVAAEHEMTVSTDGVR